MPKLVQLHGQDALGRIYEIKNNVLGTVYQTVDDAMWTIGGNARIPRKITILWIQDA